MKTREEALVELKEELRSNAESALNCIETFLRNREQCGVGTDATFIKWIEGYIKERKHKAELLMRKYERDYPDIEE